MNRISNREFNEKMRERTKQFALQIINITNEMPHKESARIISKQLLRSATSVAANFRAACRGRSKAEFYSKMCIVVEEADETQFWLEMLCDSQLTDKCKLKDMLDECSEIIAITTSIKNKLKI
ncbi:MAG: four helix bundle protein [Dysgonamonadaceae bacterium]|jgi:four helix bundle protein|nr:four helix bundle protein [Dysgonamonadaceae bacterium]